MDDSTNATAVASSVAQAIAAALDWSSPPDARKAAIAFLESVKTGDARTLANTSLLLVRKNWPSEIRLHGFKLLQHLVRFRWEEFNNSERKEFANLTANLLNEVVHSHEEWALKSQTAALVAEVVRREGVTLWHELLPNLISLSAKGAAEAELVAMVLRWLPEDITVHNEDLEGDRRRALLRGLTESLPEICPLLYTLLERHFGDALSAHSRQEMDMAKQHAAIVVAVLNAVNAYAEWAPVPDLAKYGLIHGCGSLMSYNEFRLHACEFFKFICQRKRPADANAEFDAAIAVIFQILMNVSREFFTRCRSNFSAVEESEFEFMECICECMVNLASSNLQCIAGDGAMIVQFLQQMLEYFQHFKFILHFQSLLFWQSIMKESALKAKSGLGGDPTTGGSLGIGLASAEREKKGIASLINEEIYAAILDVSLQRMLKKTPSQTTTSSEALELWSEETCGKTDFGQYRSRLLVLIKLISVQKPLVAAARVSGRISSIVNIPIQTLTSQEIAFLESMQLGLETVVSAIFDGSTDFVNCTPETKVQLHATFEGLLQQLLSLRWSEPTLAVIVGRYLDSLGPYMKYYPDSVAGVVNKLFELLTSIPFAIKDPSLNSYRHARLQICTSFIRIARAAERSLLPHMKGIGNTMARLQVEGLLPRGEHNILGEAFLVMASSAGIQQQKEVLEWLLEPLSKQWTQLEWQNTFLSEPLGLSRLCSDSGFMWSIFHTVTFFEKALKRSGVKKTNLNNHDPTASDVSTYAHPMSSHLSWMLPPLIRLIYSVHSLWSQPIAGTLSNELKSAKVMSQAEHATLLGEGIKPSKGPLISSDGSQNDASREGEAIESDLRNWLKGIRDSGYNVIGLAASIGDTLFRCMDSSMAVALMENVQTMEFRHIRLLIHLVIIPLVKCCPSDLWEVWLIPILLPLLSHCQQALSCSWASLLHEGRAKVPDSFGNLSGMELKVEVMEEKLLRDLTREVCSLLSTLASLPLNSGLPLFEQLGPTNRVDQSSLKDLGTLTSKSVMAFLLIHQNIAFPALRICIDVLAWTDGEAVTKVVPFCESLILLAIVSNSLELRAFVGKDLFFAIIQGLSLESNAIIGSELLGLCREIYIYLSDTDPNPRQVLLSLPCITRDDLLAFEDALNKTSSPKEQKQHLKSLLLLATGNKLKALAAQKITNVITNVTVRAHNPGTSTTGIEDDNVIGLAAIT